MKVEKLNYSADIAERDVVGRRRMVKREAKVLGGKLVGMVDTVVAGAA